MNIRSTLLLLGVLASVSGLAILLRAPAKTAANFTIEVGEGAEQRTAPSSGEITLVEPTQVDLGADPVAAEAMGRRTPGIRRGPSVRPPVQGEDWRIFFRPVPHQDSPLRVTIASEECLPVFTLSSVVEDTDLHVVLATLPRAAIDSAILRVGTSRDALEARDGRPILMTDTATSWALGSVQMGNGRKSTRDYSITGLTVPLQRLAPIGKLTVSGRKEGPVDLLVWTSPREGFPLHTLLEGVTPGKQLNFGTFAASENWFADLSPGDADAQSNGAAIGRMGTDLLLQLR